MKFLSLLAGLAVFGSVGFSADTQAPVAAAAPAADAAAADRLAQAQILMQNMRFRDTMMKVLEARKEAMARMIDQSAMTTPAGSATPVEIADYKKRMMDAWWNEMKPDDTMLEMAKVYADLFTADQLEAMADFYHSAAGQALVEKTLELQQKSAAILTTRMEASMPVLQSIQREFMAQHPAKPTPPAFGPHAGETPGAPPAAPAIPSAPTN